MKKKRKKHDETVLLRKDKLSTIEVLIRKTLIDSYITHDEFLSVNNMLKEHDEMGDPIKNPKTSAAYGKF